MPNSVLVGDPVIQYPVKGTGVCAMTLDSHPPAVIRVSGTVGAACQLV